MSSAGGKRRLLCSGSQHGRGPPAPPQPGEANFRGGGGRGAAGAGAALQPHPQPDPAVPGRAWRAHPGYGLRAAGQWTDGRAENTLDGGAPNYRAYETLDGKYIAIGPVEPKFWARLLRQIGGDEEELLAARRIDRSGRGCPSAWPGSFAPRTREEWCRLLEGSDVCFAPVLSMAEAPLHPHNRERQTFVEVEGVVQPAPAPRFSRTPSRIQRTPAEPGEHTRAALKDWGVQRGASWNACRRKE